MSNLAVKTEQREILVQLHQLTKSFPLKHTIVDVLRGKPAKKLVAVDDVSLDIYKGESLGVVGESGCGKTTLAKSIVQLYKPDHGQIIFEGQDLTQFGKKKLRQACINFQMVFQDPYSALNPRMTVREIIAEALLYHKLATKSDVKEKIINLLHLVGLHDEHADRFPGEFSGGQQQRVGIARALALNPKLIVADEPVSALDVSIQAQIINLLKELQEQLQITIMFISHDLRVVRYVTQRVAVMYLGKIIEIAETETLYSQPFHPYTQILLKSNPNLDPRIRNKKPLIEGEPPSPIDLPTGCRFHQRCSVANARCQQETPELLPIAAGHYVSCFKAEKKC